MKNLFSSQTRGGEEIKEDLSKISKKLDQIEMALKKEGYKLPQEPENKPSNLKPPEKEKKKLSSPSVRFNDPKDLIVRDDLKNPFW